MSNPVDEFLKEAGWLDAMGRAVKEALPGAIASAGVAAMGVAASKGIGMVKERFTRVRDYSNMLKANPMLRQHDAGSVQMVYNSLRKTAPSLAADPLIAGSYIRNTLEMSPESGPAVPLQSAKLLAETQRNITQGKAGRGPISEAFRPTKVDTFRPDSENPFEL
jgi:hypothetical protein